MVSVNWITGEITVPKTDSTLVQASPEIRELDTNTLRLNLKALEDDADGMPWPDTHIHDTETTLSGIVYARKFQIIAPYFVTFEDGQYALNLVGSNNNLLDVATVNQVSIRPSNSAGLINNPSAMVIAAEVWQHLINGAQAQALLEFTADLIVEDADEVDNGSVREISFVIDPRTQNPTRVDVTPVVGGIERRRIS